MALKRDNLGVIDINAQHEVSILANFLGIQTPNIYDYRKNGKLPPRISATYRECIQHYCRFYQDKVSKKSGTMYEMKIAQDIKNGIAKEELTWLEVKKQKEQLIDIEELTRLFQPIFHIVKSNLVNLTRKYPETQDDIDRVLSTWNNLGNKIVARARLDSMEYIQQQLDKEVSAVEMEEEAISAFGIGELM